MAKGLDVDMVVVGEDCALTSKNKTAGRRGLLGTVLIHKVVFLLKQRITQCSHAMINFLFVTCKLVSDLFLYKTMAN